VSFRVPGDLGCAFLVWLRYGNQIGDEGL
jgi:hypothetical protein